jgi:hypothetical protein
LGWKKEKRNGSKINGEYENGEKKKKNMSAVRRAGIIFQNISPLSKLFNVFI